MITIQNYESNDINRFLHLTNQIKECNDKCCTKSDVQLIFYIDGYQNAIGCMKV